MTDDLKTLTVGKYTLVARTTDEGPRGVIWAEKTTVFDCRGATLDEVWKLLSDQCYLLLTGAAATRRGTEPTANEATFAIRKLWPDLSDGQRAMFRAHYRAPEHQMTATQLANAAGYAGYSAANLQYGLLGLRLWGEMPEELPTRKDGTPVMTCAIASGVEDGPASREAEWVWQMRPHIVEGLESAGVL